MTFSAGALSKSCWKSEMKDESVHTQLIMHLWRELLLQMDDYTNRTDWLPEFIELNVKPAKQQEA